LNGSSAIADFAVQKQSSWPLNKKMQKRLKKSKTMGGEFPDIPKL